jgi:hypothetical protein
MSDKLFDLMINYVLPLFITVIGTLIGLAITLLLFLTVRTLVLSVFQ